MATHPRQDHVGQQAPADTGVFLLPAILPKGNGALREIRADPATGARSLSIPILTCQAAPASLLSSRTVTILARAAGACPDRPRRRDNAAGPLQTTPGTDDR